MSEMKLTLSHHQMTSFQTVDRWLTEEEATARILELTGKPPIRAVKAFRVVDGKLVTDIDIFEKRCYLHALHSVQGPIKTGMLVGQHTNGFYACTDVEMLQHLISEGEYVLHEVLIGEPTTVTWSLSPLPNSNEKGEAVIGRYLWVGDRRVCAATSGQKSVYMFYSIVYTRYWLDRDGNFTLTQEVLNDRIES